MRYAAIDEWETFVFHDAEIVRIERDGQRMTWIVRNVNVTRQNSQNDHPTDMCIAEARVAFEAVEIKGLTFCGYTSYDRDGEIVESPPREVPVEQAEAILRDLRGGIILYISTREKPPKRCDRRESTCMLDHNANVFDVTFAFGRVVISWQEFAGSAWYVCRQNPSAL